MPHTKTARGKLLRVSSEDKQVGESNGNFSVILNNSPYVQNISGIVVKSVSFKHVFPNIYDGNNAFRLTHNGSDIDVELPVGWYDASGLASSLEAAINADPLVLNAVTVALVANPTVVSPIQKVFLFTASGGDVLGLLNKTDGNSMADALGITTSSAVEEAAKYTDTMPDLGGLSVVYLCSDISDNNTTASSNGGESVAVLTEIPITAGYTEQVHYRSHDDDLDSIIYASKRSLTRVSLKLCTRSGRVLNLQQHNLTAMIKLLPYETRAHD